MLLTELPAHLETEFSYPVGLDAVIGAIGEVEIETGNGDDPETVRSILEPLDTDSFDSPAMLYETIYGSVSDDHIGRKYYDDRGGTLAGDDRGPTDDVNVSF